MGVAPDEGEGGVGCHVEGTLKCLTPSDSQRSTFEPLVSFLQVVCSLTSLSFSFIILYLLRIISSYIQILIPLP